MAKLYEFAAEAMVTEELKSLGYTYVPSVNLVLDASNPECKSCGNVLLMERLQSTPSKLTLNSIQIFR